MSDERIDLKSLDPWPDEHGFERVIQSVTRKAANDRNQRVSFNFQLNALIKPALALAASVAIVVWIAAFATEKPAAKETRRPQKDAAFELANWARTDTLPTTSEIVRILGGSDE